MMRIIFLCIIYHFISSGFVCAAYVIRNLDNDSLDVIVEDQHYRPIGREDRLAPNEELIFSLYCLRVMEAKQMNVFFRKYAENRQQQSCYKKKSCKVVFDSNREHMITVHGMPENSQEENNLLASSLRKSRTKSPKIIPVPDKKISGYYFRNIDDTPLMVGLVDTISKNFFKRVILQPNEEFLLSPAYFKKNHLFTFEVRTYWLFKKMPELVKAWHELSRVELPSPFKHYPFDKVWNVLRHTTGFFSKHIDSPDTDKEIVAVRKRPGVNFEYFYTRTGLYNQREKPSPEEDVEEQEVLIA